jgi:hypothetical protein
MTDDISTPDPTESTEQPEVVNLSQVDVGSVTAEMVRMHQSSAETIDSDDVEMSMSAAVAVNAQSLSARQSALVAVDAEYAEIKESVVLAVQGGNIVVQGMVGGASGETVNVQNARVGAVAAREVRGERVDAVVLFAGRVEGEVHTIVDTRGAVIAGLVGGLIAGLFFLVGRIAFRRE